VNDPTDEELLREARLCLQPGLQAELLDQLFGRYHSRIGLWCYRITGNRDSAADLAQEVLMRAYQNLDSFRGESKFSTWLYTIARNHCFNHAKQQGRVKESAVDPLLLDTATADRFDLRLEQEEDLKQMRSLIASNLDDTEQQVMTLHYGEEIPLDAITRLLGLANPSGAKAYIVSARRKLKTAIGQFRARHTGRRS
jgi:RNA polymerase sigma-70 factor (ECF subfamily)